MFTVFLEEERESEGRREEGNENGKEKRKAKREAIKLSRAWDYEVGQLAAAKQELDLLYCKLKDVTDERLVDSIIYEIKSQEAKYDYHYCNVRILEERTQVNQGL